MIRATIGILASQGGIIPLLLDTYTGAAAAYSLRLLRSAYTGDAIGVRIDTTGQPEYNIGFVDGELDVATLEGYCTGGLNAYVKTWYDQSGNANNATQLTASNQPQIVSSGSVININSKPSITFGTNRTTFMPISSNFWSYTGDSTVFHASLNTHTGYQSVISYFEGVNKSIGVQYNKYPNSATNVCTDVYAPGGVATNNLQSASVQYLVSMKWKNWSTHKTNGDTIIAINGANQAFTAYGNNPSTWSNTGITKIGQFDNSSWDGQIQELVIYTSALSQSNMDGAETNINDFYSIY